MAAVEDPAAEGARLAARLREGDRRAAAAALNLVETRTPEARAAADALLEALSPVALRGEAPGHIVGLTGPPGAGKSTLLSALVAAERQRGRTIAVLAVDPSSRRSGGSLLGDRARIAIDVDPADDGVLVRSSAAGDHLGGLAASTRAAAQVLAVCFDVVVVETVGVGQSETDVADVADTVAVIVQPGSGDVLQFLKSGIMEIPDVLVITKADLGEIALRARRDVRAALRSLGDQRTKVLSVRSLPPTTGFDDVVDALDAHRATVDVAARRRANRRAAAVAEIAREHGERGLRALGGRRAALGVLTDGDADRGTPALVLELERAGGLPPLT